MLAPWKERYDKLRQRDITLPKNICLVKAMVFPVVVWMGEVDHKED